MCEHHHENKNSDCCNDRKHNHHSPLARVFIALVIFAAAMILQLTGVAKLTVFLCAYLIAGADILFKAFKNILKGKVFDENFLMSIATLGAFAIKEYPEAVMVMILYQIGEYLQHRAVEKSRSSISELMDIRPDYANVLQTDGSINKISPETVNVGDTIIVKAGEKIPLDGIVTEGKANIDTSALTGESVPKQIKEGDNAVSGCINTDGLIKIRVTKVFGESAVSKILELVEHASSKKAKAENFITKFARYYTPAVVAGAVILAIVPPLFFGETFNIWLERALTFLVISCPCALVISVPLSFFAGIGGASKCGILVKGSSYLELLSKPGAIVFDKTGTLTKGTFRVTQIESYNGIPKDELLEYTAKAENFSNHPIAMSLKNAYAKDIDSSMIKNIEEIAGNGVKAEVNGSQILVGNSGLMEMFQIDYKKTCESGTVVYTAKDGQYIGYIVISDEIKEDAPQAIAGLKNLSIKTIMLTGDAKTAAEYTSKKLGLEEVYSQLLPAEKVDKIEEFIAEKEKNTTVLFVGDGINDAPVLTAADVGIAMGGLGSDAAIEAADVVIMDDKPSKVAAAIGIARKTMGIVKQNIIFAIGVKILFLGLGAMGFITMSGAVFADVGVTLIAVLNSLRALQVKCFVKQ